MDQIPICETLDNWIEIDPFLKQMITGDEKWVTYYNIVRKRRGQSNWKGIIYYELLPYEQTLNPDIYCHQLDRLKLAINQKWPELANTRGIVFHQDNDRPHMPAVTHQKLRELGWEVLMHLPYSPNLAQSNYHLFLEFQNFPSDKNLGSKKYCENRLLEFFANRDQDFYERDIMELPLKWQ
ncbi:histone-lysine N-methyltransferase SETMAR [Trichonephila clavipes]|nr:histone-lysine N-methyltransferase SETMAR [Trichonephila clavipes]